MIERVVLWRRLDRVGHEASRLVRESEGWRLEGGAVFQHEGEPCHLACRAATTLTPDATYGP